MSVLRRGTLLRWVQGHPVKWDTSGQGLPGGETLVNWDGTLPGAKEDPT